MAVVVIGASCDGDKVVMMIVVRVIALLMVCTTWDWQHLSLQVTWSQIVPTAVVSSHCCCQHSPEPV